MKASDSARPKVRVRAATPVRSGAPKRPAVLGPMASRAAHRAAGAALGLALRMKPTRNTPARVLGAIDRWFVPVVTLLLVALCGVALCFTYLRVDTQLQGHFQWKLLRAQKSLQEESDTYSLLTERMIRDSNLTVLAEQYGFRQPLREEMIVIPSAGGMSPQVNAPVGAVQSPTPLGQ